MCPHCPVPPALYHHALSVSQPLYRADICRHSSMNSKYHLPMPPPLLRPPCQTGPKYSCPSLDASLINEQMTHAALSLSFCGASLAALPALSGPRCLMCPSPDFYIGACSVMLQGLNRLLPKESYLCSQLAMACRQGWCFTFCDPS